MQPRAQGQVRRAGFTLVELLVVIALFGVLSAMILPEMRGTYGDAVLRAAGRNLADACAVASSRAVSFNQLHRLRLDPATGRFRLERRGRGPDGTIAFLPVREARGGEGELDRRIVARIRAGADPAETGDEAAEASPGETAPVPDAEAADAQALSFYPDGTADRGEILLRDQDGFGLALRLNPVTARVRVVELKPR